MASVKVSELKLGQNIILDMGYGAHSMDEVCSIISVTHTQSMFNHQVIRLQVRRPCGDTIDVNDLMPDDRVDIQEPLRLGITSQQLAAMQRKVNSLEREADAIEPTPIRHEVSKRIVEIRRLLRDGHL